MSNAYNEILRLMRSEGAAYNPPETDVGTVKSVNPLKVEVGGAVLSAGLYTPGNAVALDELPEIPEVEPVIVYEHPEVGEFSTQVAELREAVNELADYLKKHQKRERYAVGDRVIVKRSGERNMIAGKVDEL